MKEILIFFAMVLVLLTLIVTPIVIFLANKTAKLKENIRHKKEIEAEKRRIADERERISKIYWELKKESRKFSDEEIDRQINELKDKILNNDINEEDKVRLNALSEENKRRIEEKRQIDIKKAFANKIEKEARERKEKINQSIKKRDEIFNSFQNIPRPVTPNHIIPPANRDPFGFGSYAINKGVQNSSDIDQRISHALSNLNKNLEVVNKKLDLINNGDFREFETGLEMMNKEINEIDKEIEYMFNHKSVKPNKPISSSSSASSESSSSESSEESEESVMNYL